MQNKNNAILARDIIDQILRLTMQEGEMDRFEAILKEIKKIDALQEFSLFNE